MTVTITNSVAIRRPRRAVFDFISNPCNDPAWCPRVDRVALQSGTASTNGARYLCTHRPFGPRARALTITIDAIENPHRIVLTERDGGLRMHVTYQLDELDDGASTRLTQIDDIDLAVPRLFIATITAAMRRAKRGQLHRLRTLLELGSPESDQ